MRKLILRVSVSIDSFMESSPVKLDFAKSRSPEGAAQVAERMSEAGAHLMGRKTFEAMAAMWPNAQGPLAKLMNEIPKIVFTRKGFDVASITSAQGWAESKVLKGELAKEIAELKNQPGKSLMAHGGIEFAQELVATGLVDEFLLAVHPVASGKGQSLFEKLSAPLYLKLLDSKTFSTGAMLKVFQPEKS